MSVPNRLLDVMSNRSALLCFVCVSVSVFLFVSSSGGPSVQRALCRVQQDAAGLFPVGVEECRRRAVGALGLRPVSATNQPLA